MMRMPNLKQRTYVFIPGKNWKLSLAELVSFLKSRHHKFKITSLSKPFFIAEIEEELDPSFIDDLGGIIKIGKIVSRIPSETINDAFLQRSKQAQEEVRANLSANCAIDEIFKAPMKKCVFGVSLYFEDPRFMGASGEMQRFIGSYFKDRLATEGTKAKFMGFPKNRQLPQLTHVEVLKKGLIETSAEILLCVGRDQTCIARTIAIHNPFEFQKRDINRPIQRKIFSIPPRLARIMVNLSSCSHEKALLDPFCGVGTILQEAMLMKAQTIGIDINPWCVKAACENLEWLKKEYDLKEAKYTVLLGDSRRLTNHISRESVDCIATEPDLGPALRHLPTIFHAKRIANKLMPLFSDFLLSAYKALKDGGKLVFVTPYIKTRSGSFVSMSIEEKAEAVGFETVCPFERENFEDKWLVEDLTRTASFIDMEQRHKVGREIHIFQK